MVDQISKEDFELVFIEFHFVRQGFVIELFSKVSFINCKHYYFIELIF